MITKFYEKLRSKVEALNFSSPVERVYNPLSYAWDGFRQYISRYCSGKKRVIFLGMNPGPWGMAQTGVPFGEVNAVKNFLGLNDIQITQPENMHPSYMVKGLDCTRSEVSGKRLWGLFKLRYDSAGNFFRENFVMNYCPLLFLSGRPGGRARNFTPDKLNMIERRKLFTLCDNCLRQVIEIIRPQIVIGVGVFAASRAEEALKNLDIRTVKILHPSPASPQSNSDWAGKVTRQLIEFGVWK